MLLLVSLLVLWVRLQLVLLSFMQVYASVSVSVSAKRNQQKS